MSDIAADSSVSVPETVRTALKNQYHAALAMLRDAIRRCPEELWYDNGPTSAFWQVAYHALFFTHLYLQRHADEFTPWEGHQGDVQHEDGLTGPMDASSSLPPFPEPYPKDDVLAYLEFCVEMVDGAVDAMDLSSRESGFYWYPIPKLEHQLVNIRHLQHHTAQLADRLRAGAELGTRWVGSGRGT